MPVAPLNATLKLGTIAPPRNFVVKCMWRLLAGPPPGVPNAESPKPPEPPPLSAEDAKKVSYVLGTFVATRTPLATAELS